MRLADALVSNLHFASFLKSMDIGYYDGIGHSNSAREPRLTLIAAKRSVIARMTLPRLCRRGVCPSVRLSVCVCHVRGFCQND